MSGLFEAGGLLVYPLILMSFLALILIFERMIYFTWIPGSSKLRNLEYLYLLLENNQHLSKEKRDEVISHALISLKEKYEFGIQYLRMIAVLSPMFGLLGTVTGMIGAFRSVSAETGPVSPAVIADGLWSAMITTAYGLSIALPVLLASFVFARISEKRLRFFQHMLNAKSLCMEGANLGER